MGTGAKIVRGSDCEAIRNAVRQPDDVVAPNLQLIGEGDEEITYLLQRIDPYNNNMITYSEVVQLLSSHMVPSDNPYE